MAKYTNIRQRKDGRWEARIRIGRNPKTGKSVIKYIYGHSQADVRSKQKAYEKKLDEGLDIQSERIELGFWIEYWLENYKKQMVQPTTYENYCYSLTHVKKALGKAYLSQLTTDDLQRFFLSVAEEGKLRTMKVSHCLLSAALEKAVDNGLIAKNPARYVILPKEQKKEAAVLTTDEHKLFLEALQGEYLAPLFMFQLSTGLRPGEVLGLTWDMVDFEAKIIHITKAVRRQKVDGEKSKLTFAPTKTKRNRDMELLDETVNILKVQQQIQKEDKAKLRGSYEDIGLVFATHQGHMLERGNVARVLKRIENRMRELKASALGVPATEIEIKHFTPHSIRHTFATRALEQDIPLKIVSAWLGHSSIRVTGDIYSHALPEKRRASIEKLSGITELDTVSGQKSGQSFASLHASTVDCENEKPLKHSV